MELSTGGTCVDNGSAMVVTRSCPSISCKTSVSPIVIDTDGKGFYLTNAADGVMFDIQDSGKPIQMAWTAYGSTNAFLCLPDPDGKCDDGKDLFGNFTPQPTSPNPNGFAALATFDENHDGVIDSKDPVFSSLRLWVDANHDGISQPEELHTLLELGVNSISLKYVEDHYRDQFGNQFEYAARLNPDKPTKEGKFAYDIFFVTNCK